MKTQNLLALIMLTAFALQACRNTDKETNSSLADSTIEQSMTDTTAISRGAGMLVFIENAANAGTMEIELSTLAKEKTSNAEVKRFAQRMIKDHTRISTELKKLAAEKKITLPAKLPAAGLQHIEEMKKMTGATFDKHYMDMMVNDHVKALDLFKSATALSDTDMRKFAARTLRLIEPHYKEATEINFKLK